MKTTLTVLYDTPVHAGFPSPAEGEGGQALDLNEYLVKNPSATFFVRVEGDSMEGAGIFSGDVLVVDRSKDAEDGDIVIAVLFDDFTVKRLRKREKQLFLVPENGNYEEIEVNSEMEGEIWGIVVGSVRVFNH